MQRSSIVFGFSITPFEKLVKLNPTSSTILYMCAWGGRCVHVCMSACLRVCVCGGGGRGEGGERLSPHFCVRGGD